jgi:hypothetical protein
MIAAGGVLAVGCAFWFLWPKDWSEELHRSALRVTMTFNAAKMEASRKREQVIITFENDPSTGVGRMRARSGTVDGPPIDLEPGITFTSHPGSIRVGPTGKAEPAENVEIILQAPDGSHWTFVNP